MSRGGEAVLFGCELAVGLLVVTHSGCEELGFFSAGANQVIPTATVSRAIAASVLWMARLKVLWGASRAAAVRAVVRRLWRFSRGISLISLRAPGLS